MMWRDHAELSKWRKRGHAERHGPFFSRPFDESEMNRPRNSNAVRYSRCADAIVVAALGLIAFLLGCYQLFDTDLWWQLRSGQWILENRRLPQLDIFTFSSSDRACINLDWGFQVVLALAHALGETPGI
jgi:hypothetical protein